MKLKKNYKCYGTSSYKNFQQLEILVKNARRQIGLNLDVGPSTIERHLKMKGQKHSSNGILTFNLYKERWHSGKGLESLTAHGEHWLGYKPKSEPFEPDKMGKSRTTKEKGREPCVCITCTRVENFFFNLIFLSHNRDTTRLFPGNF